MGTASEEFQVHQKSLHVHALQLWFTRANGQRVTWAEVLPLWQHDGVFRDCFLQSLASLPFAAFFWETPPVNVTRLSQPFEYVAIDNLPLSRLQADPSDFATHLADCHGTDQVKTFPNLGGDALLVVPCQQGKPSTYAHLATFVRSAPQVQQHRMWAAVGATIAQQVEDQGQRLLWVSTSGLGVPWLHVRLDTVPKYYQHQPYRQGAT